MQARCTDPKHRAYPWYGARGIKLQFPGLTAFREWAAQSGYRPGLWIQRKDSTGDYSADNCCWLTPKEQQRRRSNNRMITAFERTLCLAAWADDSRCAVSYDTLKQRLDAGWLSERAITEIPVVKSALGSCQRGHLFDAANTIIQARGYRQCRQCYNDGRRARRAAARVNRSRPRGAAGVAQPAGKRVTPAAPCGRLLLTA
jgi:hypothetical protein